MASMASTPDKPREDGATPDADAGREVPANPDSPEKKGVSSRLKGFWSGLGLDFPTLITMAKSVNLSR
jgi:hypothetical protein